MIRTKTVKSGLSSAGSLRLFYPFNTFRIGEFTILSEFASLRRFRFQGLLTFLTVSTSPTLWTIFQVQAFMGLSPSEFSPPQRSSPLSGFVALLLFIKATTFVAASSQLQSFIPFVEPHSLSQPLNQPRSRPSLGVLHLWSFLCGTPVGI